MKIPRNLFGDTIIVSSHLKSHFILRGIVPRKWLSRAGYSFKYVGDGKVKISIVIYDTYEDTCTCMVPKKSSDRSNFWNDEKNLTLISFATRDIFLSWMYFIVSRDIRAHSSSHGSYAQDHHIIGIDFDSRCGNMTLVTVAHKNLRFFPSVAREEGFRKKKKRYF